MDLATLHQRRAAHLRQREEAAFAFHRLNGAVLALDELIAIEEADGQRQAQGPGEAQTESQEPIDFTKARLERLADEAERQGV